jgi:hypothetical protein
MTATPTVLRRGTLAALILAAASSDLSGQASLRYRRYALGDDLLAVTVQANLSPPAASDRAPAFDAVQEMRWQARYVRRGDATTGDPVERLIFSFYEQRLFRIVVDYAAGRTAGMTEGDMVAAVSKIFGTPTRRIDSPAAVTSATGRQVSGVVAQWIVGDQSVALLTLQDGTTFRLILSSARIEALALLAGAYSVPTDVPDWTSIDASRARIAGGDEAPGRERTRHANVAAFVP